ncbi:GNAT family N-acetyltransferase [Sorangium sp. So ce726]|uniref:GNAT family N-acetyltransferase n=1 Tax=Sorangium sp. So ce726 TaxID=3133319 RepID=UPI003F6128C4
MNIRPEFTRVGSIADLGALRERYLDELPCAQDGLVEALVADGAYFRIDARGRPAGYCVVSGGDMLVEYHVCPEFLAYAHQILPLFVEAQRPRAALVKTFDHMFLACAIDLQAGVTVRGALVREFARRELPELPRMRYSQRLARADDLPRIAAVDQDVFTHPERLRGVVEREQLLLFEQDERLIGFGIVRPVIPGRPDVELGIAVDTPFRNRGYAVYMMRDMVEHCLARGLNPIAGCSRQNEASIRMGLRVGLLSRYRLLEIRFR